MALRLFPTGTDVGSLGSIPMDLTDSLHGHAVAAIFEVLIVDAGYQVVPLGVERSVRELRAVGQETYLKLIHPRLRSIPDFFVFDIEAGES